MHFPFLYPSKSSRQEEPVLVAVHEPPRNTSEGSEILDDALRMEDLTIDHTEESIAAGSPVNLL